MSWLATNEASLRFVPSSFSLFSVEFELPSFSLLILESFEMILLFPFAITTASRFALDLEGRLFTLEFQILAFLEHFGEEPLCGTKLVKGTQSIHMEFT